jgi:NitT/TauT family transport system permease protein
MRSLLIRLGSGMALVALWHVVSLFFPPTYLPGPILVVQEILRIVVSGDFFVHMYWTILRVVLGFVASFGVAVVLGVGMGLTRVWELALDGPVLVGLTIPGLAWAVIGLMLFGLTTSAQVFAIFMVVTPMLTVNLWEGTKAIDRKVVEMAMVFKAGRRTIIRAVILPQLVPFMLAGLRFGLALSWKTVVIAETFGATSGVGYKIIEARELLSMKGVLAWTLSFTLVMFILEFGVLKLLEARLTAWRPRVGGLTLGAAAA